MPATARRQGREGPAESGMRHEGNIVSRGAHVEHYYG
jgi:hypothetical protein